MSDAAARATIREALTLARDAVAADERGDSSAALAGYKACVARLQSVTAHVVSEPDQLDTLRLVLLKYQNRAMVLEKMGPDQVLQTGAGGTGPQADAWRGGDKADAVKLRRPPYDPDAKPFWLISVLSDSMTKGAHFTDQFFVPSDVWWQPDVKISSAQAKIEIMSAALVLLSRTQAVCEGSTTADPVVEQMAIVGEMEAYQKQLSKHLSYVPATPYATAISVPGGLHNADMRTTTSAPPVVGSVDDKKDKKDKKGGKGDSKKAGTGGLKGLRSRAAQLATKTADVVKAGGAGETQLYVDMLKVTLDSAMFLGAALAAASSQRDTAMHAFLKNVHQFLNATVLAFASADMYALMEVWMRRSRDDLLT